VQRAPSRGAFAPLSSDLPAQAGRPTGRSHAAVSIHHATDWYPAGPPRSLRRAVRFMDAGATINRIGGVLTLAPGAIISSFGRESGRVL
jgi:hypothetical protein